jgi:hypothetical protein
MRLGCHLRVTEPVGGALHIGKATLYALFLAKVVKNLQYVVVQAEKCAIFVLFLSKSA